MRPILLVALLLLAGCKMDWAGPDLSCLSVTDSGECPAPPPEGVPTAPTGDTLTVSAAQGD
jgi:hypothetical protein